MRSPNRRQRITAWFHAVCYTPKGLVAVTAQHLPMSDINESLTITAQIRWRCFRVHGITAGHDPADGPMHGLWQALGSIAGSVADIVQGITTLPPAPLPREDNHDHGGAGEFSGVHAERGACSWPVGSSAILAQCPEASFSRGRHIDAGDDPR